MEDPQKAYWESLFENVNMDLREQPYRHMDQKCTPDVIYLIAECILSIAPNKETLFSRADIAQSEYFRSNLQFLFNKPDPQASSVANEIDKLVSQPLKTLAFSGVLTETKKGKQFVYSIRHLDAMQFLSANARNAFKFLSVLNQKFIADSGLSSSVILFEKSNHTNEDYIELRDKFFRFFQMYTRLGTRGSVNGGRVEFRRILPKILNPIAVDRGIPGVVSGHISPGPFVYQDLMYNRPNWRDTDKNKKHSRADALAKSTEKELLARRYSSNENTKMKKRVLLRHNGISEVRDSLSSGQATQAHHIFPVSGFPELQAIPENIISLTASQHFQRAHPKNDTSRVDAEYQRSCLLAKLESIRNSVVNGDLFYSKEQFISLLNSALLGHNLAKDSSFDEIRLAITSY